MDTSQYSVKVVEREAISIIGMKVTTDMEHSAQDCPKLWHDAFGPRMSEAAGGGISYSLGVSFVVDTKRGAFDYWAAVPADADAAVPAGMEKTVIPAGLYAESAVDTLTLLPGAYQYIFSDWLPKHSAYKADIHCPSYELYPADYMETGKLLLYFPVVKT